MSEDGKNIDWGKELVDAGSIQCYQLNSASRLSVSPSPELSISGREGSSPELTAPDSSPGSINNNNNTVNAPKYGTLVPNRIFVGGIALSTTDDDLAALFSAHGVIQAAKVIADRAGVSKGYGFVTFLHEEDAKKLIMNCDFVMLNHRRLNIAPAIKKQPFTNCTYESVPSQTMPYSHQHMPQGMCYNQSVFQLPYNNMHYSYVMPQLQTPMQADMNMLVYQSPYGVPSLAPAAALPAPTSAPCYQMMQHQPMYIPSSPGQMQLQQYQQIQPSTTWADPGLPAQYQIALSMPHLMQMY